MRREAFGNERLPSLVFADISPAQEVSVLVDGLEAKREAGMQHGRSRAPHRALQPMRLAVHRLPRNGSWSWLWRQRTLGSSTSRFIPAPVKAG